MASSMHKCAFILMPVKLVFDRHFFIAMTKIDEAYITVDGQVFENWESYEVNSSMDSADGGFSFVGFRPLGEIVPLEDAECVIRVGNAVILTGIIKTVETVDELDGHQLTVSGASKTRHLAKSSHIDKTQEYRGLKPSQIVQKVCEPFGIGIVNMVGDVEKVISEKLRYQVGDSAMRVIRKACRKQGITVTANEKGELVLTRGQTSRRAPTSLIWGENINSGLRVKRSTENRHSHYMGKGMSVPGKRNQGGKEANQQQAFVQDNLAKHYTPLVIIGEGDNSSEDMRLRMEYEAAKRIAESMDVSVPVSGHTVNGKPWRPNALCYVEARHRGVAHDLMAQSVSARKDKQGTYTSLQFVPKESYIANMDFEGYKSIAKPDIPLPVKRPNRVVSQKPKKIPNGIEEFGKVDISTSTGTVEKIYQYFPEIQRYLPVSQNDLQAAPEAPNLNFLPIPNSRND